MVFMKGLEDTLKKVPVDKQKTATIQARVVDNDIEFKVDF